MCAAVYVAGTVQVLDHERENCEQPVDQEAVFVVVGNVLESVAVLAVVKTLVFDLPAAFGQKEQFFGAGKK